MIYNIFVSPYNEIGFSMIFFLLKIKAFLIKLDPDPNLKFESRSEILLTCRSGFRNMMPIRNIVYS